jgi:preprotein translocase subunit SecA
MASRQKARKYLEDSESHSHYSSIVEYVLTYFIARAEKEGNNQFADELRKTKEEYHADFQEAFEITEEVYADLFTDEELDDLIVLHSNPATRKARALTPEIMNKILVKILLTA